MNDDRYQGVSDLTKRVRRELEQFFVATSQMTHKDVVIEGWEGAKKAEHAIAEAAQTYVRGRVPRD